MSAHFSIQYLREQIFRRNEINDLNETRTTYGT